MIPENKFYVLSAPDEQLPQIIHVVGKRFESSIDAKGMSRNKAYLIYEEVKQLEDMPEDAIEQFYTEVGSDCIFALQRADYEHK